MGAIWRRQGDDWQLLTPSGFPTEEKLHDLVEAAPGLLPLSGSPSLVVLGREVFLGPGYADLIAVEPDGRLVVVETKLSRNAEARRAVVAQVLTYAAKLKGMTIGDLEAALAGHLEKAGADSIVDLVEGSDQAAEIESAEFADGLAESLATGGFRLVLVLDAAPSELVQIIGYLESISSGVVVDLVTVSAYDAGGEQLLVPQRVDPELPSEQGAAASAPRSRAKGRRESDGWEAFADAIERSAEADRAELRRLLDWAVELDAADLATLRTVFGQDRQVLTVWVRGEKSGLVSIWNERGGYMSLWRSVFVRLAWDRIAEIEQLTGEAIGQGTSLRQPSDALLEVLTAAYRDAAAGSPDWNGRDYYVSFGENEQRSWQEATRFGFVSAGGGEWYSRTLKQLRPGHRVFAYIPKGNGVGGYVGVGEVLGGAAMAKDFVVEEDGRRTPYLDLTEAPGAAQHRDDPALAEWVVPVRWLATRTREEAIRDADLFANQNSAVKLTHGYTLERLTDAFGLADGDPPATGR